MGQIIYKGIEYTSSGGGGGVTYEAGDNIDISEDNVISAIIPDTLASKDYVDEKVAEIDLDDYVTNTALNDSFDKIVGWHQTETPEEYEPIQTQIDTIEEEMENISSLKLATEGHTNETIKFGYENGVYGYYVERAGADTFIPFKSGGGEDFTELIKQINRVTRCDDVDIYNAVNHLLNISPESIIVSDSFTQIAIEDNTDIAIQGFNATIEYLVKVLKYTIDVSFKNDFDYPSEYLLDEDAFNLNTKYSYTGEEVEIDEGFLVAASVDTSVFSSIEDMEVG